MDPRSSRRRELAFGLSCALAVTGVLVVRDRLTPAFVSDDAWISFRYAWNLVHGRGLSWNPGQEPVEGYSNLLWVLWAALGIALGAPVGPWAVVWGKVFAWGTALGAAGIARAAGAARGPAALAAALMAASPLLGRWMGHGLETPLFAFLLSLGTWRVTVELAAAREGRPARPWSALPFGLAALSRAEGPLYLAIPLLFLLARGRKGGRAALAGPLLAALPVGAQLLVRLATFGELVPNTARAKLGGAPLTELPAGLRYLLAGLSYDPLLGGLLAAGCLGLLALGRGGWPLLAPGLVCAAFALAVGGDDFSGLRFLLPAAPATLSAAALGWTLLARRAGRAAPLLAVLGAGLALAALVAEARIGNVDERRVGQGPEAALTHDPHGSRRLGSALDRPWAAVERGSLRSAWRRGGEERPPPEVHWFLALPMETLPPGEAIFFQEVGLLGYALVDAPVVDGRGLNWRPGVDLARAMLPGLTAAEREGVLSAWRAAFERMRPALVFLQCSPAGFHGPSEELLLSTPFFLESYDFLAWGPYFANQQICAFRRKDAGRPMPEVVRARYARMEREAPDELAWARRRAALEAGRTIPIEQVLGRSAPPFRVRRGG